MNSIDPANNTIDHPAIVQTEKDLSKFVLKDSGKRQEYETGARRDVREGKGRFDLISPIMLGRLAKVMERGALKYGDRNWEKGIPLARFLDSAIRHINQLALGWTDEDHASQAIFNLMGFIHTQARVREGLLPESLLDGLSDDLKEASLDLAPIEKLAAALSRQSEIYREEKRNL